MEINLSFVHLNSNNLLNLQYTLKQSFEIWVDAIPYILISNLKLKNLSILHLVLLQITKCSD